MSANLVAIRLRHEGWHGMGLTMGNGFIQDGETPSEAAAECGMDQITYDYEALYRVSNRGSAQVNPDGTLTVTNATLVPIGKSKLAVNLPDGTRRILGRVVDWYEPLQPADLVNILDPLAEKSQLYGVGVLGAKAEIMFVQFELEPYSIGGDEHHAFLLIGDNKKMGGVYWGMTNTRVVCNNTWTVAIDDMPSFGHKDTAFTVQTCARIFQASNEARKREIAAMNAFFRHNTTKKERNEFAEAVFPEPTLPSKVRLMRDAENVLSESEATEVREKYESSLNAYESGVDLAEARRLHLMQEVAKFNDQMPSAANTAYALFNGVTAMARPQKEVRDAENRKMFSGSDINRLANSFFSQGPSGQAVERAHKHLLELVK